MSESSVRVALERGRRSVARSLALGATSGPEPTEETLTWELLATSAFESSRLTVRTFTRHEENRYSGADWLWWWEGDRDEWFGCLVQAKRLHAYGRDRHVTFDFDYRPTPSPSQPDPPLQIERLLRAADALRVPAAYALYRSPVLGYPAKWPCDTIEPGWETSAVTVVAALVVEEWRAYGRLPNIDVARPVECLTCPGWCGDDLARLAWYAHGLADPDVRQALKAPPTTAARRAFRALFTEAVAVRAAQLRGQTPGDQADQLHSGAALGTHFMRGFQDQPWYVGAALEGREIDDLGGGLEQVAGVVVVRND